MKHYSEANIHSLITRFEAQELPKREWTHEAHLVVAIWYCYHYSFDEALPRFRRCITHHNESVGTPNTDTEGYHETLTRFWLRVAQRFIQNRPGETLRSLCEGFLESEFAGRKYPLNYYHEERLFSITARRQWVGPDLKRLD